MTEGNYAIANLQAEKPTRGVQQMEGNWQQRSVS
jgi:hypothetical protein